MSLASVLRVAIVTAATILIGLVGCTSEPRETYCDVTHLSSTCKQPVPCDGALTNRCASLDAVVGPSTLRAAKDCMEAGICGIATCLSNGTKSATPSIGHQRLATNYCNFCAPDVANCLRDFYAPSSKLPGGFVLQYSEKVAVAVDDACTGTKEPCRATFSRCANDTIARLVNENVDADVAECVITSLRHEEGAANPVGTPVSTICTPTNCKGCCRGDICETGDTEMTCGGAGAACERCFGAQRCEAGKCKEDCGPNNCPGCCDGDRCIDGDVNGACGKGGVACTACNTLGGSFICANKACLDTSCRASCTTGCCSSEGCQPGNLPTACGTGGEACESCGQGRTCSRSKACIVDANALWDVYVSFAVIPTKNLNDAAWDPQNGAADPYLVVSSSGGGSTHSGNTATLGDTHLPFWAETPLSGVKASELLSNLSVEVYDEDSGADDFVGGCQLPLTQSVFDGSLQSHVCPRTSGSGEVKVYYRIKPR